MDSIIETVLKNTLIAQKELFGDDCSYVAFEERDADLREFSGFQSSLRFGRIVYRRGNDSETRYSKDLILKVTPPFLFTPMKNFSTLQFFNEAFFYTRVIPLFQTFNANIDGTFPRYYNSLLQYNVHVDETAIVFENLRSSGFSPCNTKSFLDYDHLRLMMRKLGHFHAHSYRAREEKPYEFYALARCQLETNGHYLEYFPDLAQTRERGFRPLATDPHYRSRIQHLRDLLDNSNRVFRNSLRGDENNCTHVVCHGDFLGNNVLFAYEDGKPVDIKMVDFGTWRFASPVFDLAMVLYMNADQEMRNKNWKNLLDEYYTAVQSTFPSARVPSKDAILAEFKSEATLTAYLIASFFLPTLIEGDNDGVPGQNDLNSMSVYKDIELGLSPPDSLNLFLEKQGDERATVALTDILKDMVDRGFV